MDSPYLIADLEGQMLVLDTRTRQRVTNLNALPPEIRQVAEMRGGPRGELGPSDQVRTSVWWQLQPEIWLGAGGLTRLSSGQSRFWVRLWNRSGQQIAEYSRHRQIPTYVVVNRAGTIAASADELGHVHVWETASARSLAIFNSKNAELYKVEWDQNSASVGFASTAHPPSKYYYNSFGTSHRTFDLQHRRIIDRAPRRLVVPYSTPGTLTRVGDRNRHTNALEARLRSGLTYLIRGDQPGENPINAFRGDPESFEFMRPHAGVSDFHQTIVVGSDLGELQCFELAANGEVVRRRHFVGHENLITSISQSPNGRMITTSSTDGTIRFWSLDDFSRVGDIDFQVRGTQVLNVPDGSAAQAAGITNQDEIVMFDGLPFYDSQQKLLKGEYQPGQQVVVTVKDRFLQNAEPRAVRLRLVPAADHVEPLLSLFLAADGEWVMWTPDGRYDASPDAERYLGFHVNQGRENAALWISAAQFEKQLYRPEHIDQVLAANLTTAVPAASSGARVFTAPQSNLKRNRPPDVRITEPQNNLQTRRQQVTLTAEVRSLSTLPISEIKLSVNGFPVILDSVPDGKNQTQLVQTIPLQPGRNTILLTARTVEAESPKVRSTIICDAPVTPVGVTDSSAMAGSVADENSPELHVLAVGISDYQRDDLDLNFADKDASDFSQAWKTQEGRLYRKVSSTILTNEKATRNNLMQAFADLMKAVQAGDRVVLFFSAHGVTDDLQKYYLLSHEADPNALRVTAVPHSDITEAVNDLLARQCQVLLFVDTCHAGGAVAGAKGPKGAGRLRQNKRNYWRDVGSVLFLSSLPSQISFEQPEWENGAFTEAFLEAMNFQPPADVNGDRCLSISELQTYLENRVKDLTNGRQSPTGRRDPDTPGYDIAIQAN